MVKVPEKVYHIHEADKEEQKHLTQFDMAEMQEENAWWNQKTLSNLDLSSNTLKNIEKDIGLLQDLTVLNVQNLIFFNFLTKNSILKLLSNNILAT